MKAAVVVMAREALKVAAAVPVVREQEIAGEQKWSHHRACDARGRQRTASIRE